MEKFVDILVISGTVLGCFMGLSILSSSFFRSMANKYLAYSVFLLTAIMFLGWLNAGIGIFELLRQIAWELLIPVTLLTYFLTHLKNPFLNSRKYKLLYLPFGITLIINVVLAFDFAMHLYNMPFSKSALIVVQLIYVFEELLAIVFNFIVLFWSRKQIKKSHEELQIKKWLSHLNSGLLIIVAGWAVFFIVSFLPDTQYYIDVIYYYIDVIWGLIVILLWFVMYFGVFNLQIAIEQKEIHQINEEKKHTKSTKKVSKNKNELKSPKVSKQNEIVTQFIRLLEEKEWYKNQLLSRLDIATELGISEGYLSQIINQELGKNVIHIINEYRINESKRLFQDPEFYRYSVQAIGMESGFKTKSVFYDTFKASTGVSPGIYRKQQMS
ncbi:MAG: AraC family transcriptional regulator [Bacteroidales bacterium]|nr:AraC family transcriptional regulator [Bacteroidales bacterium]MBN2821392.1 AraC family transcriptional regulator [Bacteroidales bacterium]